MPDLEPQPAEVTLHGSVLVLLQFDVCEAIRLDQLRELILARAVESPSLKHPALGYVRYERPPVVESVETLELASGERLHGEIKYYDYGVLSVIFELPFTGNWEKLIGLASPWGWGRDFGSQDTEIIPGRLDTGQPLVPH